MTHSDLRLGGELPVIVLVEDNAMLRRAIARAVEGFDCMIIEYDSAEDALEAGFLQVADLAVIDIGLPGMSGLDLTRELKRMRGNELPIIVTSGSVAPTERISAFEAGADDFVPKPLHLPELSKRIAVFLRLHKALHDTKRAQERAEQVNLYASEAAGLLAHDLANGLGISLCNLEFLGETVQWGDEEEQDACESTLRALRKMTALVNNFVEIRQLEDAAVVAQPSELTIAPVLGDVMALHRHEADVKRARVSVSCPPELQAEVDPVLVERMIHNLVGNAIRYVPEHGMVTASASLSDSGELTIEVANSGAPIPPDVSKKIFDKYVTTGDRGKRRGMGLYFCRLAAEAHGGSIALEPAPGFPARFVIRLPAHSAARAADRAVG